jgi:hypothetical protein
VDKDYPAALQSFAKALELRPWFREALNGEANVYYYQKNGDSLVSTGRRLLSQEPLNEGFARLYAYGFQLTKQQDSLIRIANELAAWPVAVEISQFTPGADGGSLVGVATGRAATEPSGKPLKPVPAVLVFEFVDEKGAVVASQEVSVPALAEAKDSPITAAGQGKGIVSWRYRRK